LSERTRLRSGEASEPSSVVAPTNATKPPTAAPESPSRFASTITPNWIPATVKLLTAIITIVARKNGIRAKYRIPSTSSLRSDVAGTGSRSSWKRVRISSTEPVENAYETASAKNGSDRARPKSAPPTGGAERRTIAERACTALAAVGSCAVGTTERKAPRDAAL